MAYNFLFNDSFTFSTTLSTNIKGDGLEQGMTSGNYLLSVFDKDYFEFFKDNLKRLYGQGSRACVFENCYIFNPLYRIDGSVPNVLSFNSIEIQYLNNFLIFVFEIGFPLGIWIYVPLIFLVLAFQKDYFSLLILFIFLLNILFSILTSEYGSRWWLYPNFLSVYLFPVSLGFIKNTLLSKFKR